MSDAIHDAILVLNAGSSSIKFSLFTCHVTVSADGLHLLYRGGITGINTHPHFQVTDDQGAVLSDQHLDAATTHEDCLSVLLAWLDSHNSNINLIAAGHRVVHGGTVFEAPVLLNSNKLDQLEQLVPLAPLHQPHNLSPIHSLAKLKAGLPQVACFDTAFHHTQPPVAQLFALPRQLSDQGIKRYGFHGLSYEYIAQQLPIITGRNYARTVVAHLGNGASMCALKDGHSMATTMGFTALDGLPMGTRCGALDAGVVLYLLNNGMDAEAVGHLLYHDSGLLGVSGISNDMRTLLESDAMEAAEAVALFVYRINRELASLVATLEGLDALIFTAGIGEHAAPVRTHICQHAAWLGITLDETANAQHGPRISTDDSAVDVWVIPANEELMIARHTRKLVC